MAGCFYTPEQIDGLPMQDVVALLALWRERPPTHEILAAVYRVAPVTACQDGDPSGIGALIGRHPDGHVKTGVA